MICPFGQVKHVHAYVILIVMYDLGLGAWNECEFITIALS